jgi:DNA (cytosine-5)-methyltransferase 1
MSWLYSQALVEEFSEAICLDGVQFAQSNGNPTQLAYLSPDKMTEFSRLSRFGMTFKPLTESRGKELLMSYLEDFRAKTSQPQEKEQGLKESDQECGEKWRGSFTKYDPSSCSWKTHQCSLLGDLEEFSETWPQWGLMRNGECWEQRTLEQTIRGTESGLSPNGVDSFHTPNTTGLDGGSNSRKALKKRQEKFPTPTCHNSNEKGSPSEFKRQSPGLGTVVLIDKNKTGGILNPTWVEWLMGWPLEWTDLKPLEMDKSHFVQQQHGNYSVKEFND